MYRIHQVKVQIHLNKLLKLKKTKRLPYSANPPNDELFTGSILLIVGRDQAWKKIEDWIMKCEPLILHNHKV